MRNPESSPDDRQGRSADGGKEESRERSPIRSRSDSPRSSRKRSRSRSASPPRSPQGDNASSSVVDTMPTLTPNTAATEPRAGSTGDAERPPLPPGPPPPADQSTDGW